MTTKSGKAKGLRLQKMIAKSFSKISGCSWGLGDDVEIQVRQMGQCGVDVIFRQKAADMFPFSIECKNSEKINIKEAIDQAKKNENEGTDWIVAYKRNRMDPIAIMDWSTLEKILSLLIEYQNVIQRKESV